MGGTLPIRGRSFPVGDIYEMLASKMTSGDIFEQHPIFEKKDIQAALLYAAYRINNILIFNAASIRNLTGNVLSSIIAKWLKDDVGIEVKSANILKLGGLCDVEIY